MGIGISLMISTREACERISHLDAERVDSAHVVRIGGVLRVAGAMDPSVVEAKQRNQNVAVH